VQAFLRPAIESAPVGVVMVDVGGTIVLVNRETERMFGYARQELLGQPIECLIPQRLQARHVGLRGDYFANPGGRVLGAGRDLFGLRKDGTEFPVEIGLNPVVSDRGMYVLAFVADIHVRKEAEEALHQSEQRYRLLFDTNPLPSWVFDRETLRILAVNDKAVRHYGYSREEFQELTITDLRPPEDVPALLEYLRTRPEGFHQAGAWRHRKKDGTLITVEVNGHPVTWQGRGAELVVIHDITQRLQAEQTLRDSELRFRQLAEHMREVFFVVDSQFRETLYISPAYEHIWGRSRQSLYDDPRGFIEAVPEDDRGRLFANIRAAQEGRTPEDMEFRVIRPDGSTRWVLARSMPVRNERGEVYRIAGVVSDVTERRGADEALAQRARLAELNADVGRALAQGTTLRDTLQRCTEAMVRHLDAAFARIWTLNEQAQVLELQASAGLYTHLDGSHSRVPVGQLKIGMIAQQRRPVQTNAVVGDPSVHDQEWAKREGMVAFAGYPLIVADRVVGVMAMFARHPFSPYVQDALGSIADGLAVGIERKQSEELIRQLSKAVEQSPAGVVITDTAGAIQYMNRRATELTGYASAEVLGKNPRIFKSGTTSPAAYRELWETISAGEEWRGVLQNRRKDGRLWWNAATISPIRDAAGRVTHFLAIQQDVTDQRHLEDQFRQAQKMEAVGRLAGGVAHDFNNLLTVISSYSDLLLGDLAAEDPRRADLEEIRKAAGGAATLTRQLLAFSRKQVLEPRVLDLNAVVVGADKMLKRLIGEDIDLVSVLAPDVGAVRADAGQIEQVIMNLAVNARDAMPDGGQLTIETSNVQLDAAYTDQHSAVGPGAYVLLSMTDTGTGMDEHTKAHIFEPFFTTKQQGKGTGLGLATVYGIVKQSGGFIWVYSELGRGTTFKIYFPRVAEPASLPATPAVPESLGGTETVLLAEDAAAVRAVARAALTLHGYTVLEAADGRTALELGTGHEGPVHLLITDIVMPGMSGRQLADRLTERRPELKVLFVSGYTDEAITRHGILEPGIAFLQKPFTPDSLARKVREVLDAPRTERR
jgi:PAS domain S-box-containing protein